MRRLIRTLLRPRPSLSAHVTNSVFWSKLQGLQDVTVNVLQVPLKLGHASLLLFLLLLNPGLPFLVAVVKDCIVVSISSKEIPGPLRSSCNFLLKSEAEIGLKICTLILLSLLRL